MNDNDFPKLRYNIVVANISDVNGIYAALKSNLVEIENVENISENKRRELEQRGFLRKAVDVKYYQKLIQDEDTIVFVAKTKEKQILGFASIHKDQNDIKKLRSTLENLYIDNQTIQNLLLKGDGGFIYLDQISILTEHKRKGIASALMQAILKSTQKPIVAFIVIRPLYNKASALWHETNGFELVGTADGHYKGSLLQWNIYIHWNKN